VDSIPDPSTLIPCVLTENCSREFALKRGKPIAPEKKRPAATKLADYRVQVAAVVRSWFSGRNLILDTRCILC
jgi:hypothetical protein